MRAVLALVAGGPIRVSTSAAAIVAVIWSGAFCLVWGAMAIGAAMASVLEAPPATPADPREADHG